MGRLEGKVAFITGAGSGIGQASARRMADDGAAIMCTDIDEASAQATAALIAEHGGQAAAMPLDVSSESAVQAALQRTLDDLGGLDVVFNNAGVGGAGWDTTIAVNLSGVYYGLFHGAAMLAENGGGVVINTASIAGLVGLLSPATDDLLPVEPGAGAYVAAKHGVVGLTKQFAITYARRGVRVNAIAPGYIYTAMTAGVRDIPQAEQFLAALHPMGRLGNPEEVAAAAAWLASDEASFVNGVTLPVDGGYTAR